MFIPDTTQSLILGIDRVLIYTQDVERVFARFRYEFGLPIAWPITDCGLLVSGGLYAGNMTIEISRFAGCGFPGTWFYGLGLAPSHTTWETVNGTGPFCGEARWPWSQPPRSVDGCDVRVARGRAVIVGTPPPQK